MGQVGTMKNILRATIVIAVPLLLSACQSNGQKFPNFEFTGKVLPPGPPVIRQPVVPEMLVGCRGHVFVPALGMTLVPRGKIEPSEGQYLREERLTPPYRVIPPGARVTMDQSPNRLNVEVDNHKRIVGLYCG